MSKGVDEAVEDLNANPFFAAFIESEHYKPAASAGYMVCVPAKASLGLSKLTPEFVATHILKLSPYFKNEYVTLNGKTVSVRSIDKTIVCKKGFPKQRTVSIRYEETYYDDVTFAAIKIQHIAYPFEGPVPKSYIESILMRRGYCDVPVDKRTLSDHTGLIQKMLGDTIAGQVTSQSDKFISSFNTSYVMVKGFIGHTGAKVRSTATQIRTEALQRLAQQLPGTPKAATPTAADVKSNSAAAAVGSNTGANAASLTKTDIAELQLAIESVVLTALHKKIFTGLCELYAVEDQRTAVILETLAFTHRITMLQVGVRPELATADVNGSIAKLATLNQCVTPLAKLTLLAEVHELLIGALDDNFRASEAIDLAAALSPNSKPKDKVISADDLLPLMVYIVIRSGLRSLHANSEYLSNFPLEPNDGLNLNHFGVHLANFVGAVRFIDSGALLDSNGNLISGVAVAIHAQSAVAAATNAANGVSTNVMSNQKPAQHQLAAISEGATINGHTASGGSPNGGNVEDAYGPNSTIINGSNGTGGRRRSHHQQLIVLSAVPATAASANGIGVGSLSFSALNTGPGSASAPNSARGSQSLTQPLTAASLSNSHGNSRNGSRSNSRSSSPTHGGGGGGVGGGTPLSSTAANGQSFDWSAGMISGSGSGSGTPITKARSGSNRAPRPVPPSAATAAKPGGSAAAAAPVSASAMSNPKPIPKSNSFSIPNSSASNGGGGGSKSNSAANSPAQPKGYGLGSAFASAAVPPMRVLNFSTPILPGSGGGGGGGSAATANGQRKSLTAVSSSGAAAVSAAKPAPKKSAEADLGDFLARLRDNDEDVVVGRRNG